MEFKKVKISTFAKVQGGYAFKSSDLGDSGIPVIKITNVKERQVDLSSLQFVQVEKMKGLERFFIKNGDVLISMTGNGAHCNSSLVGRVALFNHEDDQYVLNQRVGRFLVDEEKVLKKYLYYCISQPSVNYYLATISTGSANQANINASTIEGLEIDIPPIDIQKKIVSVLYILDRKISLNHLINGTLEEISKTIFKSWFIDFDPVYAKKHALEAGLSHDEAERAAMAIISGVCSPIEFAENFKEMEDLLTQKLAKMSKDEQEKLRYLAALFPNEFEESGLGEIPKGWKVDKIENIVTRLKAKSKYTKNNIKKQGKTIVYEQGESLVLGYTDDPPDFICGRQSPKFIFGDHTCVMKLSCIDFSISANVIPLEGKDLPTAWVYYACLGKQRFEEYRRHWAELIVKDVVVPDEKLAVAFSDFQLSLQELMENNYLLSNQLGELRDTLLPKLLAGELDLSNISVDGDELC